MDRLLRQSALRRGIFSNVLAARLRELLAVILVRQFLYLDKCLALGGGVALVAVRFHVRNENPAARGEMTHVVMEDDFLLQLDELEDVAAHAAAEAMTEASLPHHVARRRLLAVKWTETFVGIAGL